MAIKSFFLSITHISFKFNRTYFYSRFERQKSRYVFFNVIFFSRTPSLLIISITKRLFCLIPSNKSVANDQVEKIAHFLFAIRRTKVTANFQKNHACFFRRLYWWQSFTTSHQEGESLFFLPKQKKTHKSLPIVLV